MTQQAKTTTLLRDCPAIEIPRGNTALLPSGTVADVIQRQPDRITLRTDTAVYEVDVKDADALGGVDLSSPDVSAPPSGVGEASAPVGEKEVWDVLKTCYDPEIPLNLVDLGLVYDVVIEPTSGGTRVEVRMTLTAPGCPMSGMIADDVRKKLMGIPGVTESDVQFVWDPPWHHSMISAEGMKTLGLV